MLSALQQQQNSASYNPSPQALYGPVGGALSHAQGQTPPQLQRHDQAFLGQHVNPAAEAASANHRSNGDGVRSPSAAVSAGGSVMQSANANTNSSGGESPFPLLYLTTCAFPLTRPCLPHTRPSHLPHTLKHEPGSTHARTCCRPLAAGVSVGTHPRPFHQFDSSFSPVMTATRIHPLPSPARARH